MTINLNIRIMRHTQGWVVEIQKRKWYGKKYWTHIVSVSGIESMPWYHSTFDYAMASLKDEIGWQTLRNSRPIPQKRNEFDIEMTISNVNNKYSLDQINDMFVEWCNNNDLVCGGMVKENKTKPENENTKNS